MITYSSFYHPVDKRSKGAMLYFLKSHARHSDGYEHPTYSNCVKLCRLDIPRAQLAMAYAMLDQEAPFESMGVMIDSWSGGTLHRFTVAQEGRSHGHLALVYGDGARLHDTDMETWSLEDLRDRTQLVQDFDALSDALVSEFMRFVVHFEIVEETVLVEQVIRVLREKEQSHEA